MYRIARHFQGRQLLQISRFCGYLQKFSPRNLGTYIGSFGGTSEQSTKVSRKNPPICKSFLQYGMLVIRDLFSSSGVKGSMGLPGVRGLKGSKGQKGAVGGEKGQRGERGETGEERTSD